MEKWDMESLGTHPLEEMGEFFNKRADIYEEVHLENISGGMESKQLVAAYLPDNTRTIIDIGIGTGLELEAIFKRFPDVDVVGLDIAENMMQLIKERYPDRNIDLRCESYLEHDFGNELYDAALSLMTLHHYSHDVKTSLYRKILGSIKQGGIYIECDYMISEDEYENAQEAEDFYYSEYERLKDEQKILDGREYHYDRPCTVNNQIKMLNNAGFVNVREVWRRKNTVMLLADKQ